MSKSAASVFALDKLTGKIMWHRPINYHVKSSALSDRYFAITTTLGRVFVIDAISGKVMFDKKLPIYRVSLHINDETLYIGSEGTLIIIDILGGKVIKSYDYYKDMKKKKNIDEKGITKLTTSNTRWLFMKDRIILTYLSEQTKNKLYTLSINTVAFSKDGTILWEQKNAKKTNSYFETGFNNCTLFIAKSTTLRDAFLGINVYTGKNIDHIELEKKNENEKKISYSDLIQAPNDPTCPNGWFEDDYALLMDHNIVDPMSSTILSKS